MSSAGDLIDPKKLPFFMLLMSASFICIWGNLSSCFFLLAGIIKSTLFFCFCLTFLTTRIPSGVSWCLWVWWVSKVSCELKRFQGRPKHTATCAEWLLLMFGFFCFPCSSSRSLGVSLRWDGLNSYWQLILTRLSFLHHMACLIHVPSYPFSSFSL